MQKYQILWADDEIDLLKPHILFLNNKGYEVTAVVSGNEAVEKCLENNYDCIFLDENMPGMSGLEALAKIKIAKPSLPVVMVTKSEEEHIMEEAIGSKIADYLIKPVNPNQLLLSLKKIIENKRIVSEKVNSGYQQDFRNISMAYNDNLNHEEWADIYKKLIYWELELEDSQDSGMAEVLENQKSEANSYFCRFIRNNFEDWLNNPKVEKPILSHQIMKKKVFPLLKEDESLFFLLIDNLRYDQWRVLEPIISELFNIVEESSYYAILPTTTAYARNAIFAGMLPDEIQKNFPQYWVSDDEEDGKNNNEDKLFAKQLEKNNISGKMSYHKILNVNQGKALNDSFSNLLNNKVNVVVYNFVDMLSHARTDMAMIKELAADEAAYRSLTKSWFLHSPLYDLIKKIASKKGKLVITTDHGTIRVKRPFKIVGDKETNSNLRYKNGRNLTYEDKNVFSARKPELLHLPKKYMSSSFAFAEDDYFFAYPNNYNHYVSYYKDTFQHGGVSLEEMIIPFIVLEPK